MTTNENQPRRRGRPGRFLLPLLALTLAACGGDDESLAPALRVPDTGTYAYDAIIQVNDSAADTLSGTIAITDAAEDSIVGVWSVQGYNADIQRAPWNVNAYALAAQPNGPGGPGRSVTHRVWRQSSSQDLQCQLAYRHVVQADTFISSTTQNRCSLVHAGP